MGVRGGYPQLRAEECRDLPFTQKAHNYVLTACCHRGYAVHKVGYSPEGSFLHTVGTQTCPECAYRHHGSHTLAGTHQPGVLCQVYSASEDPARARTGLRSVTEWTGRGRGWGKGTRGKVLHVREQEFRDSASHIGGFPGCRRSNPTSKCHMSTVDVLCPVLHGSAHKRGHRDL